MYDKCRDPEIGIIVHADACCPYNSRSRGEMVEILTPPENITMLPNSDTWGSIMSRPEQLRKLNESMNILYVNNGTKIVNSKKDAARKILWKEMLTPQEITGRWLKWFRYARFGNAIPDINSMLLYRDYESSRMRLEEYINRLPHKL